MNRYPLQIRAIYIAPQHRVFGKGEEDLSGGDVISLGEATAMAHAGIEGDRFCRHRPDYDGHATFFSQEVWEEVSKTLQLSADSRPALVRRNILVSGIDLKALYGQPFEIDGIRFQGTVHCAPCLAMNRALGAGGREALRGRGGLRAQVKSSGILRPGPCELLTDAVIDPRKAATRPPQPKIP